MIHETEYDPSAGPPDATTPDRQIGATTPQPCWMALDAARALAFTGEIVFHADPDVRVYLDNGVAYYAERSDDPSLGSRLLDAGVVDAAQLERGTVRVGGVEHLGRLFDRAEGVDRDAVMVVTEEATEQLLTELANHVVTTSDVTAYRHHESGVHRWFVAPHAGGPSLGRPVSEVAPVDNSVVEDLPGLRAADGSTPVEELHIEWDHPLGDLAEPTGRAASNGDDLHDESHPAADVMSDPAEDELRVEHAADPEAEPEPEDFGSLVIDLDALVTPMTTSTREPWTTDDDLAAPPDPWTAERMVDPADEGSVAPDERPVAPELPSTEAIVPLGDEFRVVWPDGTEETPSGGVSDDDEPQVRSADDRPDAEGDPDVPSATAVAEPPDDGVDDLALAEHDADVAEPAIAGADVAEPVNAGADVEEPVAAAVGDDVPPVVASVDAAEPVGAGADVAEPVAAGVGDDVPPVVAGAAVAEPGTGAVGDDVSPVVASADVAEPGTAAVGDDVPPAVAGVGSAEPGAEDVAAHAAPLSGVVDAVESPTGDDAAPLAVVAGGDDSPMVAAAPVVDGGGNDLAPVAEDAGGDDAPAVDAAHVADPLAAPPSIVGVASPAAEVTDHAEPSTVASASAEAPASAPTGSPLGSELDAAESGESVPELVLVEPEAEQEQTADDDAAQWPELTSDWVEEPVEVWPELVDEPEHDEAHADGSDGGPRSSIGFEVPPLVLGNLPSGEGAVPDEVTDAVLRAIRAIENASTAPPSVGPIATGDSTPAPAGHVAEPLPTGADEPPVDLELASGISEPSVAAAPAAATPAPLGFPPPTPETSAEAIYAARAAATAPEPEPVTSDARVASVVFVEEDEDEPEPEDRAGALRRLINSLRRR